MEDAMMGIGFILAIFACVVLHELGHALMARRFKITTKNITLYPIGGVASLEKMPDKPKQELLVAIAGPLVNIVIALILYAVIQSTTGMPSEEQLKTMQTISPQTFLFHLFLANAILALFNLLPAFPMDGGRMLRAVLAMRTDRVSATQIAAAVGRIIAIFFVFMGFFTNFWLVFIGMFVYLGAGAESAFETTKSALEGLTVKDVLMTKYSTLYASEPLSKAVQLLLDGQDTEFIVLDVNGQRAAGVLTKNNIILGLSRYGQDAPVSNIMEKNILQLTPDMSLPEVMQKMMESKVNVCPVYENDRLVGILDQDNIQEAVMVRSVLKNRPSAAYV